MTPALDHPGSTAVLATSELGFELARSISDRLELPLARCLRRDFPDTEFCVQVVDTPDPIDRAIVVHSFGSDHPDGLLELLEAVDAVAGLGASTIVCVVPYLAYARQDRRAAPGDAHTLAIVLRSLAGLGATSMVTVEAHNESALHGYGVDPVNLSAAELFGQWLKSNPVEQEAVIVSPDAGGRARARELADLCDLDLVVLDKTKARDGTTCYREQSEATSRAVRGRLALVVDDVCSSGSTLLPLGEWLRHHGAAGLDFLVAHFFGDAPMLERTSALPLRIRSTDSRCNDRAVVPVAPNVIAAVTELLLAEVSLR